MTPMSEASRTSSPVIPVPALDDAMLNRHVGPLHPQSALDRVALVAARTASESYVVSSNAVRDAMATQLGSGLWPHVLVGRGTETEIAAQLDAALAELRQSIEISEVGTARATGQAGSVGVVIAIPAPRLPVAIERGTAEPDHPTRITMAWPWSDPPAAYAVTATRAWRLAPSVVSDELELAVDCTRPAAIEIWAGMHVVATVVDACGGRVDVDPAMALEFGPPAFTQIEIEERVFELVNRERAEHHRAPLAWDGAAHRFARQHAADMARNQYVGHEAPDGSSLDHRVATAEFAAMATRENVGYASGLAEVHVAFMASPGHRANLLASDVDRGAIGIAFDPADPNAFYITEFFRMP